MIGRANPVAKLAVALVIPLLLVLSVDPVTAGTALLLEVLALPWCGVAPRTLLRTGWVVLLGAIPAGILTTLFNGPLTGAAITLRILAIGLPGVVLIATTDPTDLADALAQVLRLPHRFVLSALAALRLFGVLAQEWEMLSLARRARGIRAGRFNQVFALLVLAVRRATTLATAMEARGFGVVDHRTWARPSRFRPSDYVIATGGLLIGGLATAAGIAAGTWTLILT